jgi:ATP-dependent Lhr-like helicase
MSERRHGRRTPGALHAMDSRQETLRQVRSRLGPLWNAFFAGFGNLTPIQWQALPILLEGANAVICSPTASGKTEAVLAPVISRILGGQDGPALLYVIPTRALVADMQRRFGDLFRQLELSAAFRTSDSPHVPERFPLLLFTTPESLDSLLCRRPHVWRNVRCIVLDELHLLDNTYRGDQLRVLLARLGPLTIGGRTGCGPQAGGQRNEGSTRRGPASSPAAAAPQMVALSATISDPLGLARRYIGEAEIIHAGEPRRLVFEVVPDLCTALTRCRAAKRYKILAFCNARRECEELSEQTVSARLWPRDGVFVHHASLSAAVRREVEAGFRESRAAVCFATMTLELGIDIGDVSAALLYRAPPNAEAFMQRLGRACRREGEIFALGIAAGEDDEAAFRKWEAMMRHCLLEVPAYVPDLSVVVQQVFSMLFANPAGMPAAKIGSYVSCLCSPEQFAQIIDHLVAEEHVLRRGGTLLASERTMDMGEKGQIHTNIADSRTMQVFDVQTGRLVGETGWQPGREGPLTLAGRAWEVTGASRGRLHVRPTVGGAGKGFFAQHRDAGRFMSYLPRGLRTA